MEDASLARTSEVGPLQKRLLWSHFGLAAVAASCGAFAVLGWAPYGLVVPTIAAYTLLFRLLLGAPGTTGGLSAGFAFGVGLHLAGHGWMYTTLHDKVGLQPISASLSTLVFASYLALFTGIPCWLFAVALKKMRPTHSAIPGWTTVFGFAAMLTLGEWLRGVLFNGFTSLSTGYVALDTWLAGFAPVGGLYLDSLVILLIAGSLGRAVAAPRTSLSGAVASLALVAIGVALTQMSWARPVESALSYALVQSSRAPSYTLNPTAELQHARHIVNLILQQPAVIVATPETTFKAYASGLPGEALSTLQQFSRRTGSNVFLGVVAASANSEGFNSVLQVPPDTGSDTFPRYDKTRLMAFGEYSPSGFGWFTRSLNFPLKDLSPGAPVQEPFVLSGTRGAIRMGTLICIEDMIGRDAIRWAGTANLLLNPTNLAWFDGTLAIDQRLQIARMRALETARPMLRVANTGITAHIDAKGTIVAALPMRVEAVLRGSVQPMAGLTPYARFGDALVLLLCTVSLVPVAWRVAVRSPDDRHLDAAGSRP